MLPPGVLSLRHYKPFLIVTWFCFQKARTHPFLLPYSLSIERAMLFHP